jgi:GNAT superfamily N-acetyltransferase
MAITVVPFVDEHLEPACGLLAARHAGMKQQHEFLSAEFTRPRPWLDVLGPIRAKAQPGGLVALADGEPAGYLLWAYDETAPQNMYAPFSPPGGVETSSMGFAVDPAWPSAARRLYAAASSEWIADGRGTHGMVVPATEQQLLDELYGLGFGRLFSLAARASGGIRDVADQHELHFRQAVPGDEDTVRRLAADLWHSYAESPVHFPFIPESMPDLHAHADRYVADPASPVWLAERNGRAQALEVFLTPGSEDWFLAPPLTSPETLYLFWASTAPDARGSGVHSALLAHTSQWAQEQGYSTILLHYLDASFASEYWKRQGFRQVSHWLSRRVDPRTLPST